MATISVKHVGEICRITMRGSLSAVDLKRLEQACGLALEQKSVPLEVDVFRVTSVDAAALWYLERLRERGARILGDRRFNAAAHSRS